MQTMLNIAALSRRTGVAPDTLRKWEQRYGVLRPLRTAGGQRRYTERDLARVEWLRDRLAEGWRIGEAARVLDEAGSPALDRPEELRQAIAAAVEANATGDVAALVDQAFSVLPLEVALSEVAAPVLRWAGDEWHAGRLSVAQEHALTQKIRARLDGHLSDARGGVRGTAVLACAPGEHHDLGLLMLGVLLQADGWRVEYLGADMPVDEALAFAGMVDARLICLSATRAQSLERLRRALPAADVPHATVFLGGGAVTPAVARALGAQHANGSLSRTVEKLRAAART